MRIGNRTTGRTVWLALVAIAAVGAFASADGPPAGHVGSDACAACHEDVASSFQATAHGRVQAEARAGSVDCESCVGTGATS